MAPVRRKRRRPNWPLVLLLGAVTMWLAAYVAVVPSVTALWRLQRIDDPYEATEIGRELAESLQVRLLSIVVSSWFIFLGASFGSFLNVMAWRLPRGRTLQGSSYCPYCAQRIAFYDNVPLLGWLALRGRCRTCRLPISPRYVLIELFTAVVFYGLFRLELLSGGANLPQFSDRHSWGSPWVSFTFDPPLMAAYAHHALLLTTLITSVLIEWDGLFQPPRLYAWMCGLAVVIASIFPRVLPAATWWSFPGLPDWMLRVGPSLAGLAMGALLGWLAALSYGWSKQRRRDATDPSYILLYATVGAFLGWRAVAAVACLSVLVDAPLACLGALWIRSAPPQAASLLLAVSVLLGNWRAIDPLLTTRAVLLCGVAVGLGQWLIGRLQALAAASNARYNKRPSWPEGPAAH